MQPVRRLLALAALLALLSLPPLSAHADLFGRDTAEEPAAAAAEGAGSAPDQAAPLFTAEALVEALPYTWHGTFAWDGGSAFFVEMEIVKLTVGPDGEVEFNANTRWLPDLMTARMSGRIDPATLQVRIWEIADDASADGFESDGAYTGAFAPDLWDLRARWETNGSGDGGDLVLVTTAAPAADQ